MIRVMLVNLSKLVQVLNSYTREMLLLDEPPLWKQFKLRALEFINQLDESLPAFRRVHALFKADPILRINLDCEVQKLFDKYFIYYS